MSPRASLNVPGRRLKVRFKMATLTAAQVRSPSLPSIPSPAKASPLLTLDLVLGQAARNPVPREPSHPGANPASRTRDGDQENDG